MRYNKALTDMGNKIQLIRKSKGVTIRQLGALCGLDYSNLSRLENGQVDAQIMTLRTIATALKVDVKEFL